MFSLRLQWSNCFYAIVSVILEYVPPVLRGRVVFCIGIRSAVVTHVKKADIANSKNIQVKYSKFFALEVLFLMRTFKPLPS